MTATSTPPSPKSRSGTVASPATPSFFIIHEANPTAAAAVRSTPTTANDARFPPHASRGDLEKQRSALASRQSLQQTHSLNSGSPGPRRHRSRTTSVDDSAADVLHEETEEDLLVEDEEDRETHVIPSVVVQPRVLSILNRCGSSPDLPLHNPWSSTVFSSSKKRQLLKPTNGTGASPQFTSLQRSRLIPLPINIRTGTLKKRNELDTLVAVQLARSSSLGTLRETPDEHRDDRDSDAQEEKMNYEISISSLKQRISLLEKELAKALRQRHVMERQVDNMAKEQHALHGEKVQLTKKLDDLESANLHQRHAFDKLSERYTAVYSNLAKLTDVAASSGGTASDHPQHVTSVQLVVQTLTRENQELHRKVHVLETRHAEDKVIVGNQEKQLRRLRAEMEALQHMAGSKEDSSGSSSSSKHQQLRESTGGFATKATRSDTSGPTPTASQGKSAATAATAPTTAVATASTTPPSEETAYIDPNILKVLEKVDSQFSITNAISLSAALKKWLHSCLHIVASTDLHGVLHVVLKRVCELLHCQHAAIFHVDHRAKKLVGLASERGRVRWEMPLDKGILGHAARYNVLCNVRKAYDDPRFFSSSDTITETKSREVLCIPLTRELDSFLPDASSSTVASTSVFAVLQCWNTTTQKPFSQTDQILGGLLTIHTGIVLSQTRLSDNMQRVHNRVLQIAHMNDELAPRAAVSKQQADAPADASAVSIVHLVRAAQRKFAEIVGITKLRIFVLDSDVMRAWHVGAQLEAGPSGTNDVQLVRKYANVHSSLCSLLLAKESREPDEAAADTLCASTACSTGCRILLNPTAEPTFNDTVDLQGGANGLYLAAIRSPWREMPLGMIQVARVGAALAPSSSLDVRPLSTAAKKEKQHAQQVDDALTMELIELFCQQFSSLLHHAMALQLHETCPGEVQDARLAYLTDRLDLLEREYLREQEEAEAEAEAMAKQVMANVRMEQKLLESVRLSGGSGASREPLNFSRPSSGVATQREDDTAVHESVPLISTDSSYAIDMFGFSESSASPSDGSEERSSSRLESGDSAATSLSPSDDISF